MGLLCVNATTKNDDDGCGLMLNTNRAVSFSRVCVSEAVRRIAEALNNIKAVRLPINPFASVSPRVKDSMYRLLYTRMKRDELKAPCHRINFASSTAIPDRTHQTM